MYNIRTYSMLNACMWKDSTWAILRPRAAVLTQRETCLSSQRPAYMYVKEFDTDHPSCSSCMLAVLGPWAWALDTFGSIGH